MSKIGRKSINIEGVEVTVAGQKVNFKGKKASGTHELPEQLVASVKDNKLTVVPTNEKSVSRDMKMVWGMHRALLANKILGASVGFEKQLQINGLGFKAALMGNKLDLTLGFSHKVVFDLPKDVTVEIDKTGQLLTFRSPDKELVGAVCDRIRSFRPPEPYKGTGIKLKLETIIRKAGKTKAAA
jgi:large subunit ribosomal protein L6